MHEGLHAALHRKHALVVHCEQNGLHAAPGSVTFMTMRMIFVPELVAGAPDAGATRVIFMTPES